MLQNGFVDQNDDRALLQNPHYRGLGVTEPGWMWTTISMGQYRPLTWMTYGAAYVLWALGPRGYHLTTSLEARGNLDAVLSQIAKQATVESVGTDLPFTLSGARGRPNR